ncbi:MAG: DUF1631 domain-containing protein, partial [Gammaproteobacteria bacterium]|nr:DUF1631 domain-containing protein [Gammaproteobacteria bacterium]
MSDEKITAIETGFSKLSAEIRSTLDYQVKKLFASYIESADTALFDLANEAGSNAEQKQYFELMQHLRADKKNLLIRMSASLDSYLQPASKETDDYDFEMDHDDGELSLVSQDTMEEMVVINAMSSKAAEKFNEAIGKLSLRLDYLADRSADIFSKDALLPVNFCKSFKESIAVLDITIADKIVLYKLFDAEVIKNLNSVYDILNSLMIEAGVLPNVKLHARDKSKQTPSAKNSSQSAVQDDETCADTADADRSVSVNSAAGAGGQNSSAVNVNNGQQGANTKNTDQTGAQTGSSEYYSTAENSQASAGSSEQNLSGKSIGGYPVERASEIIRNYMGGDAASTGSAEGSAQYYGHNDVLSAFTKMQAITHGKIQKESPAVSRIDASEIKQALLSTIASQQGGAITKSVDHAIEKTIDFIKLIFDAIIDDNNISDTIKALLLTLQIPVIKASMLDQSFFVRDDHPARQLLDKVSEVGVGVTSNKDELYRSIHQVIQKLLAEYINDINAFVIALENIAEIISARAEIADEKERQSQLNVQKLHARKIVLWELRRSTLEKKLPTELQTLVLKLWPTMMFNHFLRNGKENDEWITLVTTLRELIDSIQVPDTDDAYAELKANYMPVTIRVERQLNKFQKVKEKKDEAIQALREIYTGLLDSYVATDEAEHKTASEKQ